MIRAFLILTILALTAPLSVFAQREALQEARRVYRTNGTFGPIGKGRINEKDKGKGLVYELTLIDKFTLESSKKSEGLVDALEKISQSQMDSTFCLTHNKLCTSLTEELAKRVLDKLLDYQQGCAEDDVEVAINPLVPALRFYSALSELQVADRKYQHSLIKDPKTGQVISLVLERTEEGKIHVSLAKVEPREHHELSKGRPTKYNLKLGFKASNSFNIAEDVKGAVLLNGGLNARSLYAGLHASFVLNLFNLAKLDAITSLGPGGPNATTVLKGLGSLRGNFIGMRIYPNQVLVVGKRVETGLGKMTLTSETSIGDNKFSRLGLTLALDKQYQGRSKKSQRYSYVHMSAGCGQNGVSMGLGRQMEEPLGTPTADMVLKGECITGGKFVYVFW